MRWSNKASLYHRHVEETFSKLHNMLQHSISAGYWCIQTATKPQRQKKEASRLHYRQWVLKKGWLLEEAAPPRELRWKSWWFLVDCPLGLEIPCFSLVLKRKQWALPSLLIPPHSGREKSSAKCKLFLWKWPILPWCLCHSYFCHGPVPYEPVSSREATQHKDGTGSQEFEGWQKSEIVHLLLQELQCLLNAPENTQQSRILNPGLALHRSFRFHPNHPAAPTVDGSEGILQQNILNGYLMLMI